MATKRQIIPALRVNQWMKGWDAIDFSEGEHRKKPSPYFFMFSISARELRSLSGISRRQSSNQTARAKDLGIQRQHDVDRSEEIKRFVQFGYPWSTLSEAKRKTPEFNDLRKPGWLPTAIVVNILQKGDARGDKNISSSDVISIDEENSISKLSLPYEKWTKEWKPQGCPPIEIIDGQHRLWAFDRDSGADNFEVPVVAFCGLDISWQAYLFWTINVKPKRINSSLAFDLYPLLRAEDWLDRAEGHAIYRETRAQELTEILWSHTESPWYDRINMLGERGNRWVSQSAWIKSLIATFVKPWSENRKRTGGLFGSRLREGGEVLGWNRAQQAAFLILIWKALKEEIENNKKLIWAKYLREAQDTGATKRKVDQDDAAFYGKFSLLTTDQGVRGFLQTMNDLCFASASKLELDQWHIKVSASATDQKTIANALRSLEEEKVAKYIRDVCKTLASFDWRSSATPGLPDDERRAKLVFRGSSGYKELKMQLLEHINAGGGSLGKDANHLMSFE